MAKLQTLQPRVQALASPLARVQQVTYGRGRGGRPWRRIVEAVRLRDKYQCRCCGHATDQGEVDHIVPTSQGGSDEMGNLQYLCRDCHAQKSQAEAAQARGAAPPPR